VNYGFDLTLTEPDWALGFRFDGVTSMLYLDHGLERAFLCGSIPGQHFKILPSQARKVGLREAHDRRTPGRSIGQESLDLVQTLIKG
jgi:hypothetical protein